MRLFKQCEDPLVMAVRKTYQANLIRMPRADVSPLCLIASNRQRSDYLGALQPLLDDGAPLGLTPRRVATSNALLEKSQSVNIDVGLKLLSGFLPAWGVPSAEIGTTFQSASKVTFRFSNVFRSFVDSTELSSAIEGRHVRISSPLMANFTGPHALGFYVIDATITSREFTMRVEHAQKSDFKLDVPAIQEIVEKAHSNLTVASKDASEVTFKGDLDMPFAFSCLQFILDNRGRISAINLHESIPSFGFNFGSALSSSTRVLLSDEPGLLEFESDPPS